MGMSGVAEMLRKSGAFFIRRRFGGDTLYWALITEYLHKCVCFGGHPLEMFVEGTRSRSGKSLPPKIGINDMRVFFCLSVLCSIYMAMLRLVFLTKIKNVYQASCP